MAFKKFINNLVILRRFASFTLNDVIVEDIKLKGPISVAKYMRIALTHPELLLAIWLVNEWRTEGKNNPFVITELGAGRGLALLWLHHLIKVLKKFPDANSACRSFFVVDANTSVARGQFSRPIQQFTSIDEIPENFTNFFIANEFLDALPIHRFEKRDGVWREVLVGINSSELIGADPARQLCFVLANKVTLAQKTYLSLIPDLESRNVVEISPDSAALVQRIAQKIDKVKSGAALFIDYGHLGDKGDTFRAFSKHQIVHPLQRPGQVDLTADVDFSFLLNSLNNLPHKCIVEGPVSQAYFLINLGILPRLKVRSEHNQSTCSKLFLTRLLF
ncbi:NADH dehydrogenase [ubiquinone] complex I, assembly factor 7 [Cichlidogyrus casuarinus]|uniref:Protein arginine methyltransferase NDUFAF7 n=1 Tax=Cichlidogyrus casuarinus TaxID=1844966 RepID=A0ABD2PZ88_9PLAT